MKLIKIKEFLKENDTSKSSIYRILDKYPHLKEETKLVSNRRLIPVSHQKYFDMDLMIQDEKRLKEDIKNKSEMIDLILKNRHGITDFWQMSWDLFVTVSYKDEINPLGCHSKMSKFYEKLKYEYGGKTNLRMLFTTEEYDVRDGSHNHFVLFCSDKELLPAIKEDIKDIFRFNRITIDDYDHYRPGIFYICKQGLKGESWDFFN